MQNYLIVFKIDTPLGSYNPDWAVMIEKNGEEKLYFVIETKGSMLVDDLRPKESYKIDCAKEHFRAIETEAVLKKQIVLKNYWKVYSV